MKQSIEITIQNQTGWPMVVFPRPEDPRLPNTRVHGNRSVRRGAFLARRLVRMARLSNAMEMDAVRVTPEAGTALSMSVLRGVDKAR